MQDQIARRLLLRNCHSCHLIGWNANSHAGFGDVDCAQADYERQRCNYLKVDECLQPHASDLLEI